MESKENLKIPERTMLFKHLVKASFFIPKKFRDDKVIFIHIPKCAGSSFLNAYLGYQLGHVSAKNYFRHNPIFYCNADVFSICRHPIKRFVSAYKHLKRLSLWHQEDIMAIKSKIQEYDDINTFIQKLEENSFVLQTPWFRPQFTYVTIDDYVAVNKIFKLEDLDENFSAIQKYLGIDFSDDFKINRDPKPSENMEISPDSISKLESIYHKDFTLFGYY